MFKNKLLLLTIGGCLASPMYAGTVINTFPDGTAVFTNGFIFAAQTFTAPAANVLSGFEFNLFESIGNSAQLDIYAWSGTGPTGPVLYQSAQLARNNNATVQDVLVSNINLPLTTGVLYGAVIDLEGDALDGAAFNTNQNSYNQGAMWLVNQADPTTWVSYVSAQYNLAFDANFVSEGASSTPEPGALYLFGSGLVALLFFRRRPTIGI